MAPGNPDRLRQRCRILLRRLRIGTLWLILAALAGLLYLNQVGLPGFIKDPLLGKLRARGLDLQFTRLRWRWYHGIVAENVLFGRTDETNSPRLALKQMEVRLGYRALAKFQFQVDSLVLRNGRLTWPVAATNEPPRELVVDGIQTELRLRPQDLWQLDWFQARFAGADIQLTGMVTNASAVRSWRIFHPKEHAAPGTTQRRLRELADSLAATRFSSPPQLRIEVRGDARDLQSFLVRMDLKAPDAETPWGTAGGGSFMLRLSPASTDEVSRAEITLQAETARTRWAVTTNLNLKLRLFSTATESNVVHADLGMTAAAVETEWGRTENARFSAQWIHSLTNAIPSSGRGELCLDAVSTRWGTARELRLAGVLATPANSAGAAPDSWAWWTNLAPYALEGDCQLTGLESPHLQAEQVSCGLRWNAPDLEASHITARLYGGRLAAQAQLNVATRQLRFSHSSDFDVQKISGLLTEKSRTWLAQYSWRRPPAVQADGTLTLPPWTNRHPDWHRDIKASVALRGHFQVEEVAFRGIPLSFAESHFSYSNETWRLPDLHILRPEGQLNLVHESNERTRDYYFRIRSTVDVRVLRPLLEPQQQRGLDFIQFSEPPHLDGEVWGRWYDHERIGARAFITLTNFSVRGQPVGGLQTFLEYTNKVLQVIEPRLQRNDSEQMSASRIRFDFAAGKAYLTNGFSTADPTAVAHAIGPRIGRHFDPYHFVRPPVVHAGGTIPLRDVRDADLRYDVDGGPFEWWKLKTRRISGSLIWRGEQLFLQNVRADFYQGQGSGSAEFDFRPKEGTDFKFDAAVNDADLHALVADLTAKTNRLEGLLNAHIAITHANSTDPQSYQGKGRFSLRDGLIWEIPLFGILSPVLDGIMPGLGSSRANEASARFLITNSVVASDDLEIHASAMRLHYWGTMDLKGRVSAHAEAELLRDTWVLGRVLSLALWPVSKVFEYRITGTVHEPRSEPVFFIPRMVLMPFHHGNRETATEDPSSETNASPPVLFSHPKD